MPPLATLLGAVAVLLILARMCATARCQLPDIRHLPFIAEITQGICPKCGDAHPDKASFVEEEPKQFWQRFRCRCGYQVAAHLNDD